MALERQDIVQLVPVELQKTFLVVDLVHFVHHALRVFRPSRDILRHAKFSATVVVVPQRATFEIVASHTLSRAVSSGVPLRSRSNTWARIPLAQ